MLHGKFLLKSRVCLSFRTCVQDFEYWTLQNVSFLFVCEYLYLLLFVTQNESIWIAVLPSDTPLTTTAYPFIFYWMLNKFTKRHILTIYEPFVWRVVICLPFGKWLNSCHFFHISVQNTPALDAISLLKNLSRTFISESWPSPAIKLYMNIPSIVIADMIINCFI